MYKSIRIWIAAAGRHGVRARGGEEAGGRLGCKGAEVTSLPAGNIPIPRAVPPRYPYARRIHWPRREREEENGMSCRRFRWSAKLLLRSTANHESKIAASTCHPRARPVLPRHGTAAQRGRSRARWKHSGYDAQHTSLDAPAHPRAERRAAREVVFPRNGAPCASCEDAAGRSAVPRSLGSHRVEGHHRITAAGLRERARLTAFSNALLVRRGTGLLRSASDGSAR